MNNRFGGLFWASKVDYKKNSVEWEGHYDETKTWKFIGANTINENATEDNIIFVNGDITSPDCFLALQKEYNPMNELSRIHFCYPQGLEPVQIWCDHDYKDFLEVDEFKNAVIIGVRHWHNEAERIYYIVSNKERELLIDYKENPKEYFIDDKQVSHDDYMHEMCTSIEVDDVSLVPVAGAGIEIKTFVEQDRYFKNCRKVIKAVKQSSLEKDFIHIHPDTERYRLMEHFYTPLLGRWFRKYEWNAMVEKLKKPHVPYVIKGTNKPPYFMIDDYIVNADTASWYEFILKYYFDGKVQDWMLEKMSS